MAKDLDDCEHWLLPQFLTDDDDDLFAEFKNSTGRNSCRGFGRDFHHDFAYGFGPGPQSDLSSPSTETESDEDEYMFGLTQKLARSTLEDSVLAYQNKRSWGLSGSPQSTLCSALGGCGCNHGSSRGSSNCQSQVASPPRVNRNDGALDLLYAAAGEVARMRMMERAGFHASNKNGIVGPPRKPSSISLPQRSPSPNLGFCPDQTHLSYQQHVKAAQFQQLRQQQMMKQQAAGAWGLGKFQLSQSQQTIPRAGGGKPNLSMAAWPTLEQSQGQQQPPGSGMRAVFLGNPCSKRECAGTGVFLPRRFGTPAETRKKPAACSTVLLPDRVVQALNLNLEAVDTPAQPRYSGGVNPDYDASAVRYRNGVVMAQQRTSGRQQMNHVQELRLPQEWTY